MPMSTELKVTSKTYNAFITDSSLEFNIPCISETSQKKNVEFHKNIILPIFPKPYSSQGKVVQPSLYQIILKLWKDMTSNNIEAMERYDIK